MIGPASSSSSSAYYSAPVGCGDSADDRRWRLQAVAAALTALGARARDGFAARDREIDVAVDPFGKMWLRGTRGEGWMSDCPVDRRGYGPAHVSPYSPARATPSAQNQTLRRSSSDANHAALVSSAQTNHAPIVSRSVGATEDASRPAAGMVRSISLPPARASVPSQTRDTSLSAAERSSFWSSLFFLPVEALAGEKVVDVQFDGENSGVFVMTPTSLWSWGVQQNGLLGNGTSRPSCPSPCRVARLPAPVASSASGASTTSSTEAPELFVWLSVGNRHGAAVTSRGRLLTWGMNSWGAGHSSSTISRTPSASTTPHTIGNAACASPGRSLVKAVSACLCAALDTDGTVVAAARAVSGRVDMQWTDDQLVPAVPADMRDVRVLFVHCPKTDYQDATYAIDDAGRVWSPRHVRTGPDHSEYVWSIRSSCPAPLHDLLAATVYRTQHDADTTVAARASEHPHTDEKSAPMLTATTGVPDGDPLPSPAFAPFANSASAPNLSLPNSVSSASSPS